MTIDDLKRVIRDLPGLTLVYITTSEDDCGPVFVTLDSAADILRLLTKDAELVITGERVLEDYSGASGRDGVGA